MSINRTAVNLISHHRSPALLTHDASKNANSATKFTRPVNDRAPGASAAFPGFPDIDPRAPEAEKNMFEVVNYNFFNGTLPLMGLKLNPILSQYGNQESRREDFTFMNEPASIQVVYPRTVINAGSEENGTAGQLSFVNGAMESAKGDAMQNPEMREHLMKHAGFAIGTNIARQKNMPFAVAALQGRLNALMLFNEHNQYIGR